LDWLDKSVHKADRHSLLSIVISFLFKVILYRIVGRYIFLFKSPETKAYQEFSLLIQKACIEIQNAIINLKDFKDLDAVKESCIKINSIENIADDVQSSALIKLFETNDPITIIKVQQVLNYLEEVTDKAEEVAGVMSSIIIKYA